MGIWIKRVYKQHSSFVVTLNKRMCLELGITKGDYLVFELKAGKQEATVIKYGRRKGDIDGTQDDSGTHDPERRALPKDRVQRREDARARRLDPKRRAAAADSGETD